MQQENYFYEDDEKTILKENLLVKDAEEWAKKIARDGLKSNQIRKFYNESKLLENRKKAPNSSFEKIKPLFKMLKSKVAYAASRKKRDYGTFKRFIDEMVDNTNTDKEFEAFLTVFESVLGFFVYYAKE